MAQYDGLDQPESSYGFSPHAQYPGQALFIVDFYDEYNDRLTGVTVIVAPTRTFSESLLTYDGWANDPDRDILEGAKTARLDAPLFTWAAHTTIDSGAGSIDYVLVAGDRTLHLYFLPQNDLSGNITFPGVDASAKVAAGIRTILCG